MTPKAAVAIAIAMTLQAPSGLYHEPLRPQMHFTPPRNFMNDPNGLVFYQGEYHLFYQHNPFGERWGHMSWGHAVSSDMVHWKHLPVALREEGGVMIFSGSVVADPDDTSGLCGSRGTASSCLVAIYTGHGLGKQTQNLAFSSDRGRSWTKYAANPVIDLGLADFRDPKVFWHAPSRQWIMLTVLADQHKLRNLRRDPRVSLSFEAKEHTGEGLHPYVVIRGRATITEGGALEVMDRLAGAYIGPGAEFPMRDVPPGVVIHVAIEKIYGQGPWQSDTAED